MKMIYNGCLAQLNDKTALKFLVANGELDLNNPSKRFDQQLAPQLMNKTVNITGDTNIGLKIGTNFRPETLLDMGYAFPFCANLREVIALNRKYQPLIQQIGQTDLTFSDESAWLEWSPKYNDPEFYRYYVEMIFTGYATIGRWLLWGDDNPVLSMHFRHKAPDNTEMHKKVFCDNVIFGAKTDKVEFMGHTVDVPMPNRNAEMLSLLKLRLDAQLAQLTQPLSVKIETIRCIQAALSDHRPTITSISKIMGMSERSLRRKLHSEDTSFRELLQHARRENCEAYIKAGIYSQSEIALMLGFNDHSAYSRAFKTWFKKTPSQYLEELSL